MPAASRILPDLPEHVWRGRELAQAQEKTLSTGHAALDAQLPGGGWPLGSLVEVLQQEAQQHVWQLLGPALASALRGSGDPAVLVHPPYQPFGPALRAQGIPPEQLLCVHAEKFAARLWATEQALRCADVCAVLAWLPQARNEDLRRLHLCAQAGEKLLVAFRGVQAQGQSSPARLRLMVGTGAHPTETAAGLVGANDAPRRVGTSAHHAAPDSDTLQIRILKRRGPPLLQPLSLQAQPARLRALLAARKARRADLPLPTPSASHVLDRPATVA